MWNALLAEGGPTQVPPNLLRALGIYGGAQGIWVNKRIAAAVARVWGITDEERERLHSYYGQVQELRKRQTS